MIYNFTQIFLNIMHQNISISQKTQSDPLRQYIDNEITKELEQQLQEREATLLIMNKVRSVNQKIDSRIQSSGAPTNPLKELVSKQKLRYNSNGHNLDLTYITDKVIAMGYPAENFESVYRNSMEEVQKFFKQEHPNHHRIYNLCTERKYKHSKFQNNVAEFPFDDHQVPSLELIYSFCVDVDDWLSKDNLNVVGIHCKAGKGRTGLMICCYLLYSKQFQHAVDSMKYFGIQRTKNHKGVTIPSQIRYVYYFEKALKNDWIPNKMPQKLVELVKIRLIPLPLWNIFSGCKPWFSINNMDMYYSSQSQTKLQDYKLEPYVEFNLSGVYLEGDVRIKFYNNTFFTDKKLFQLWFNCDFINDKGIQVIDKFMLDKACKDKNHKKFQKDFRIEIHTIEKDRNSPNKSETFQI